MSDSEVIQRTEAVRRFNRFYTRQIGLLQDGLLSTPFSLTEARVIYELAHHDGPTATHLGQELRLDAGYLSRLLRDLQMRGLITRRPSETDRRQQRLSLTRRGQEAFARLNAASRAEIEALLGPLGRSDRRRLLEAMHTIERLLGAEPEHREPYILRPQQSGDMGWVVQRHGVLYTQEYGWDDTFEALVAEIVAAFIRNFDPRRERCWIAEKDGENVGCVFLVRHPRAGGGRQAAPAAGRARGPRAGHRQAAGRGVHPVRATVRLPHHHAVDQQRAARRPEHLPARGLPAGEGGAAPQLRPRPHGQTWELALDG